MPNLLPRIGFLIQSLYRAQKTCPHCKSERAETIARKYAWIRVKRCPECLLCFTDPIYEADDLYDETYIAEGSTTEMPSPTILAELKRIGFEGTDKDFASRIARIRRATEGDRLLEIGSSWGYFLFQASAQGYEAHGYEIGNQRREYGVNEVGVSIASSLDAYDDGSFDVVYSSHVLEHFTDASSIFKDLVKELRPGGRLVLEVPRFDSVRLAKSDLRCVGAVHPLGFSNEFFSLNLPLYGLEIDGFYDSWESFPDHPREGSSDGQVILMATKPE